MVGPIKIQRHFSERKCSHICKISLENWHLFKKHERKEGVNANIHLPSKWQKCQWATRHLLQIDLPHSWWDVFYQSDPQILSFNDNTVSSRYVTIGRMQDPHNRRKIWRREVHTACVTYWLLRWSYRVPYGTVLTHSMQAPSAETSATGTFQALFQIFF